MRRPAVFFDRDNTLIIGNDYLGDPAGVVLVDGAAAAIARCRQLGYATVVVSNQSGVARGMFDEDAVRSVNARMDEMLLNDDKTAVIDRHEFCPFHPEGTVEHYKQDSFLRKPQPGMILAAAESLALDLSRSWLVGDAPRDITAGKAAGCRTILVVDPAHAPSPAAAEKAAVEPDFIVANLAEAIDVIQRAPSATDEPAPDASLAIEAATNAAARDGNAARDGESVRPAGSRGNTPVAAATAVAKPVEPMESSAIAPPPPPEEPEGNQSAAAHAPFASPFAPPPAFEPAALPAAVQQPISVRVDLTRLELASAQMLMELKRLNEHKVEDFSLSKLVAGVVQVVVLLPLVMAYMNWNNFETAFKLLMLAIFLETAAIAFLIMGRQK